VVSRLAHSAGKYGIESKDQAGTADVVRHTVNDAAAIAGV
jgi:hypothetical protein